MAHYFTREEAETLLPQISIVLQQIRDYREVITQKQEELDALHMQAMGNGYHLQSRINKLQQELAEHVQVMQALIDELHSFGCVLKDPSTGLIDFLSMRNGREVYLCWLLGEDRINFWHFLDAGFAGRQPL